MTEPLDLYDAMRGYIADQGMAFESQIRRDFASLRPTTIDHLLFSVEKHGDARKIIDPEGHLPPYYRPTRRTD